MTGSGSCEECGGQLRFGNGVHLSGRGDSGRLLCLECFNAFVSARTGVDFEHPRFSPVAIDDCDGDTHTFELRTMFSGDVVTLRAVELFDTGKEGYEFLVVGDPEEDTMQLFGRLYDSMRRELGRKHLVETGLGLSIGDGQVVTARITSDSERDGHVPRLVIDGREIPWDEFGRMLMAYEGFKFKLQIYELDDEEP